MASTAASTAPKQQPSTDLANQLQQLAVAQHVNQGRRHMGKASLLYTFQEASDINVDTIYRVGVEGLDQLCTLDGRFQAYRRTLFGQASQSLERDGSTQEVNAKLDAAIAGFCTLLSSYFLLAPAFKALEYLVRKYQVHERNVEDLMLAALPYHETEQFVRLVQILRLEPRSRFAFLEPMQKSGAPAPREALVLRCVTDRSLLRFVCDMAQRQADPRVAGRVALPFYAVLVCEYLAKVKAVDEPLLTMLLPYLLAGLTGQVVADYRAASYMIIGQLAARATFTADLASVLATETCRTASADLLNSVVMLLAHLANSQEHLRELPDKAFKHLAQVIGLVDELAALSEKGARIERLLALLVRAAMVQLPAHPHYGQLLEALLTRVDMGRAGRLLADAVLQQAAAAAAPGEQHQQVLLHLLRTLDLRCPEALDAAVSAALPPKAQAQMAKQQRQKAAAGQQQEQQQGEGQDGEPSAQQQEQQQDEAAAASPEEQRRERVLKLLNAAFEGTARCPLLEAGTTVLLAAEAPSAGVRQLAVERLDALASSAAAAGSEAAAAAGAALLRRLQDDCPSVVQAVLGSVSLMRMPPAAVFDGLAACFDRAMQQAGDRAGRKAQRAEARGVVRKVLKLVTGPLLDSTPSLLPRVLPLLLASLLVSQSCGRKVAATAAKAVRQLDHPLLAALQGMPLPREGADDDAPPPPAQAASGGRRAAGGGAAAAPAAAADAKEAQRAVNVAAAAAERRKSAVDAAYNAKVVAVLSNHAAVHAAAAAALVQLLSDCTSSSDAGAGRAEPLLLMVAHAAMHLGGHTETTVAVALLRQLQKQQQARLGPAAAAEAAAAGEGQEPATPAAALPRECFEEVSGVPTGTLMEQFIAGQLSTPSMRSTALLAALRAASWADMAPRGSKDALPLVRTLCTLHWQPALATFLSRMAEQRQDAAVLLSELFAAPPEAETVQVQVVAVQLAAALLQQRSAAACAANGKKAAAAQQDADAAAMALLARALCTLCHPDPTVRQAGLTCAQACAKLLTHTSLLTERASEVLGAALTEQVASLTADAESAERLLEVILGSNDEPTRDMARYVLPAADAASLGGALMAAAEAEAAAASSGAGGGAAVGAYVARHLLAFVADWAPAGQLLGSCQKLLASASRGRPSPAGSVEAEQRELLLAAAAGCFTARRMESLLLLAAGEEATAAVLDAWCAMLEPTGTAGTAAARLAALQQVEERAFALLPAEVQGRCLRVLLRAASKDANESCREAARSALAALPLHAKALLPLLKLEQADSSSGGGVSSSGGGAAEADVDMADAAGEQQQDEEEADELLQQLQAAAAAAAAKLGTPRAKQRRGKAAGSQDEQAAAEEAVRAAAAAVEQRRQQLAQQRQARQQGRQAAERSQQQQDLPGAAAAAAAGSSRGSDACVAAIELLQWKENVRERLLLVPAVQAVLEQLLGELSSSTAAAADLSEDEEEQQQQAAAAASMPAAEAIYLVQLCLSALRSIAREQQQPAAAAAAAAAPPTPTAGKTPAKGRGRKQQEQQAAAAAAAAGFDLGLAVRAAQLAPDGAVRNAALELVAELATGMPQAALAHVLDVVAVVGTSAALQEDEQSERVASQALRAILPAWTAAGSSLQELAAAVVGALPRVSPHRRLPLLSALVSALPQVEGLCNVLALLLEQAVHQQRVAGEGGDADMAEAHADVAGAAAEVDPAWAADLAGDLMEQAPLLLQAAAAAALLEHGMAESKQQPWQPLPLLSVAFVTQQLERRQRAASAAAAADLAEAYQRLMQQALLQLQRLGERQAAAQKQQAQQQDQQVRQPAAPAALLRAGTAGCYRLLRALQQHMPPAAFLSALVALAGSSPADRVRRKALQLLTTAVRDAASDAAWQQAEQPAEAAAAVAAAALSVCQPAVQLLQAPAGRGGTADGTEPVAALTKQTALAAVGAVAGAFGQQHPEPLLAALPAVLSAIGDEQAAVRGSALAATAALAAALGPRLVPLLPRTVATVIDAVQSAAAAVTNAAAAKEAPGQRLQAVHVQAAAAASGSGSDSEGGAAAAAVAAARQRRRRRPAAAAAGGGLSEASALELAAALAAVAALVEHLGAFLAPHLPLLLGVLLHPAVLQCSAARCADVATAIRRQLAQGVPTRLLLPPLLAHLDVAAEAGADSACGLLRMLSSAVDAMDAAVLLSHHEAVFAALLRALDLRRRRPASLLASSDGLDRTEAAAVGCFVALTMRLTEARFKPLFFRLLEWAHAVPAGDSALPAGTAQLLRSVSLFSLVNALSEKLRGVFVPYYGLLLDTCVAHLTDGSVASKKGKKKRRKPEAAAAAAAEDGGSGGAALADDPLYVEHDWRLRLKVIRALHRCFVYDTGAGGAARFLDEPRFQRLLPPLVAHLGLRPPASLAPALQADGATDGAANLEAALQLGDTAPPGGGDDAAAPAAGGLVDPFGRAVVACLAQLAVTAGSDALWKPLNHQVLMMTRSLDPRTRLLALETVGQLVGRVSEEYLALLPETLPFLAELLEDAELAVEARAQRLVRQLEALSGESLEQYLR